MKLSIIIPVYNESKTIGEIIRQVKAVKGFDKEIIVVNDGSTDKTSKVIKDIRDIKVINHQKNQGKGSAIRTGIAKAGGDYLLVQDADLEYDPQDISTMLTPIRRGKAEVVYGSRFTGQRRNMFFWHWIGNQFLTLITNILYNTTLSDMETCYKLMPTKLAKSLNLKARHFEFEPEVTAKILKKGIRIWEVPISYAGREYHEGKKISAKDAIPALWTLVKERLTS
jgi:glycosyltransferase involved in cell wall biosynthesis